MKKLRGIIIAATLTLSSLIGVGTFLTQQKGNEAKEVAAANTTLYSHTLVKADFDYQYAWTSTDGNFWGNSVTVGDSYAEMQISEYWNYFKFRCTNDYYLDTISMPFSFGGDAKATLYDLNGSSKSVKIAEKTFTSSSVNLTFTGLAYKGGTEFEIDIERNPKTAAAVYGRYIYNQNFVLTGYNTINVTLDKNEGTGGISSVTATPGSAMPTISSSDLPTRAGYTFDGYWTTGTGGTKYYNADGSSARTYTDTSVTKLYAHWVAKDYTVKYNGNKPGNASSNPTNVPADETWTYDKNKNLANGPSLTGWEFAGWYKESSCSTWVGAGGQSKKNLATGGTVTIYAGWQAITYNVSYNANKPANATSSVTDLPSQATWTYDSNATLGSAPKLTGWTFGGWYKDEACTIKAGNAGQTLTKPNYTPTKNTTIPLYAKWTANTYGIVYNGNKPAKAPTNYNVTDLPAATTWTYDNNATLGSAPKLTGYEFDGWYKNPECTIKAGNAGQVLTKPNYTPTQDDSINLYAKWVFNAEVQAVVNAINGTKTCSYEDLTGQITIADDLYNDLDPLYQAVVDSEGYTHILENAKAADAVGQMIEDLGQAQDTPEWRQAVEDARDAYEDLEDKSFIPLDPIMVILTDDEAAVVVMDIINLIGDPHWTEECEDLIINAENAYDAYIDAGHPHSQIANYQTMVDARIDYDNVQLFVDKVQDITDNPFEYTEECKALIDEARRYFEEDLSEYQQNLSKTDASYYYDLLVNYENAYNAMYLIDQINDMENSEACKEKIEAARAAVDALDTEEELPLVRDDLLKELADKEAGWSVIELINAIYPMVYGEKCETAIKTARNAFDALKDDQEEYVVNYYMLLKAEEDYAAVKKVVEEVDALGDIRYDEESLEKIEHARESYTNLTEDQKALYPDYSLEDIVDYETAYEALEYIYDIGEVNYDTTSEGKIADAREFYDSLSDEQKALINADDLDVLVKSETHYSELKKKADIFVIIMLIVACLAVVGGLFFIFFLFKRRKDDEEKKNQPAKALSVAGLLPVVGLVSHYVDAPYVALYAIGGLAVLIWIAVLVLFLMKKKRVGVFTSVATEQTGATAQTIPLGSQDEITITDEKGNIFQIRFIKSFTAKLIQANDESKKYYEELKNEVLSYKDTTSRVSWHYDSINSGRNQVLKFAVRGKTLCVYFPLDADKLDDKYKVEKAESKRFEEVPCLYRIKNDRRLGYAKELIAEVCKKLGLKKGEAQNKVYVLPYEENKPLVARGLIKEQKIQVNKPSEPVVLESKVNADGDEIVVEKDAAGNIFEIRFIKSFSAKLSQASDEVKDYYNALKNYVLSYKNTNSRISWHYDAVNVGREQVLKFAVRGKTLCVYFALDADKLDEKYKVEKSESRRFSETPCLFRIKNDRRFEYSKELIDLLMKKLKIEKGKESNEDYRLPYESTKALLAKGLIKENKVSVTAKEAPHVEHVASISAEEADAKMTDEVAEEAIVEETNSKTHTGKKDIINIDTLEANFNDGDTITLEALIEKKLVAENVGYVKVLARGKLDKKFNVSLQEYSLQAAKMILLVGGTVHKVH